MLNGMICLPCITCAVLLTKERIFYFTFVLFFLTLVDHWCDGLQGWVFLAGGVVEGDGEIERLIFLVDIGWEATGGNHKRWLFIGD